MVFTYFSNLFTMNINKCNEDNFIIDHHIHHSHIFSDQIKANVSIVSLLKRL